MEETLNKLKHIFPQEVSNLINISNAVTNHKTFAELNSVANIRIYSEYQVWSVWDFMSILKVVQNFVFTNDILWIPPENPTIGNNLYNIVVTEETDICPDSNVKRSSHLQSFISSMDQMGADTKPINVFLNSLKQNRDLLKAIEKAKVPKGPKEFVLTNNRIIKESPLNAIAILTLTRETFLPSVFNSLMKNVKEEESISNFIWYHKRHIQLDTEEHGPLSKSIFTEYMKDNTVIKRALEVCIESLAQRNESLNEVYNKIKG